MTGDLRLISQFSGENTGVDGTLEVNGVLRTLDISGDASARGWSGTVDGEQVATWDDAGQKLLDLDEALTGVFELVSHKIEELGADPDDDWVAYVTNGRVVALVVANQVLVGTLVKDA